MTLKKISVIFIAVIVCATAAFVVADSESEDEIYVSESGDVFRRLYRRQVVVLGGEDNIGGIPSTLGRSWVHTYRGSNKAIIPNLIAYEYLALWGHSKTAKQIAEIDPGATVYEVYSNGSHAGSRKRPILNSRRKLEFENETCQIYSSWRDNVKVYVMYREFTFTESDDLAADCTAILHLNFFGLENVSQENVRDYYTPDFMRVDFIVFDKERIIEEIIGAHTE